MDSEEKTQTLAAGHPPGDQSSITMDVEKSSSSGKDEQPQFLTGASLWVFIVGLCFAMLLVGLDFTLLSTAIPTITQEFHSLEDIGWYASTYIISGCACMPMICQAFRLFSAKWVYLACLAVFEVGSIVCATAQSSGALIIGRAVLGIGSAGLFPGGVIAIAHCCQKPKQPVYTSITFAFFGASTVIGPIIGGILTERVTWRWCFWINLPLGAVVCLTAVTCFRPRVHPDSLQPLSKKLLCLDPLGFVLFTATITMLLLAIQWGGQKYPWRSSTEIGLFCGFAVSFVLFVLWQWKQQDRAGIPPRIFCQRSIFLGALGASLSMGASQLVIFYLPIFFQAVQGVSPTTSGVRFLGTVAPYMFVSLLGGKLVARFGYFNPLFLIGCMFVAIGTGLLSTLRIGSTAGSWIGFQVVFGLGYGLIVQSPSIAAQILLPFQDIASGACIMSISRFLGSSVWISVAQSIFQSRLVGELQADVTSNLDPETVLRAGVTGLRAAVAPAQLPEVLQAYVVAINNIFYVAAAIGSVSFFAVLGMKWVDVRKK